MATYILYWVEDRNWKGATIFDRFTRTSKKDSWIIYNNKKDVVKDFNKMLDNESISWCGWGKAEKLVDKLKEKKKKCTCKVGHPHNNLTCPIHGNIKT